MDLDTKEQAVLFWICRWADKLVQPRRTNSERFFVLESGPKSFNIPKTTLHDRVRQKNTTAAVGAKPVLNEAEEARVAEWALHKSKISYGRTR